MRVPGRSALAAFVLALVAPAPMAAAPQRAQRPGGVDVEALLEGCDLPSTRELGGRLPQRLKHLVNHTAEPVRFVVTMNANALFGPEHVVATFDVPFGTIVFPPAGGEEIGPGEFAIPFDVALGTAEVTLTVTADVTGSKILAQCSTQLNLVRPGILGQVISIPVRFAIVEGAPSALGKRAGEFVPFRGDGTKVDFQTLLEDANRIWRPQAAIVFRMVPSALGIPVIADPLPPPDGGPEHGDLSISTCRVRESANIEAERAWQELAPEEDGILVVIANRTPGCGDTVALVRGVSADLQSGGSRASDLGVVPRQLTANDVLENRFVAMTDPSRFGCVNALQCVPGNAVETLAHELGHVLTLGHGDGEDNNGDGVAPPDPGPRTYDGFCDALGTTRAGNGYETVLEDVIASPGGESLMNQLSSATRLKVRQIEQARDAARVIPGAVFVRGAAPARLAVDDDNSDGVLVPEEPCDPATCGTPGDVSIGLVSIARTPELLVTTFSMETLEPVPAGSMARFAFLADLDADGSTGGAPQELGLPTGLAGVEAVIVIDVTGTGADPVVSPFLWLHAGGAFGLVSDARITADAAIRRDIEHGLALGGGYSVRVPDDLLGTVGLDVRLQAIAQRLDSDATDRVPRDPSTGGLVSLRTPVMPTCEISPPGVNPPGDLIVHASGLAASRDVDVYLADRLVGQSQTDAAGTAVIPVSVPSDTPQGLQSVVVVVRATAQSATAELVVGPPTTPVTRSELVAAPYASGWNDAPVVVELRAEDTSAGPGIAFLTFGTTGAQAQPDTQVAAASADVAVVQEGITTVEYFATSLDGREETRESRIVRLDQTPPVLSAQRSPPPNAAGWNNTDVTVTFSCSDALSGVLSKPADVRLTIEGRDQFVDAAIADLALNPAAVRVGPIHIDKTPPTVACTVATNTLWPPNHELADVGLQRTVADLLDSVPTQRLLVYSDEAEDASSGGETTPDAQLLESGALLLRAERQGQGHGRIYLLLSEATDAAGNRGLDCAVVLAPRSQRSLEIAALRARAQEARLDALTTGAAPEGFHLLLER